MTDKVGADIRAQMTKRIASLEEQFAKHSHDVEELKQCSLRTERSLQRLLSGLERFIGSANPALKPVGASSPGNGTSAAHKPPMESTPVKVIRPTSRV